MSVNNLPVDNEEDIPIEMGNYTAYLDSNFNPVVPELATIIKKVEGGRVTFTSLKDFPTTYTNNIQKAFLFDDEFKEVQKWGAVAPLSDAEIESHARAGDVSNTSNVLKSLMQAKYRR